MRTEKHLAVTSAGGDTVKIERKWTCVRDVGHVSDEHSDDKGPPAAATERYSLSLPCCRTEIIPGRALFVRGH